MKPSKVVTVKPTRPDTKGIESRANNAKSVQELRSVVEELVAAVRELEKRVY